MKKLALVLLLVPAFSSAAVKVDSRARCGEDITEQSFELADQKSFDIENSCGLHRVITLKQETADFAEFLVETTKEETSDKGEVDCSSTVKVPYGEPVVFKCSSAVVDAELELIVSVVESSDQDAA